MRVSLVINIGKPVQYYWTFMARLKRLKSAFRSLRYLFLKKPYLLEKPIVLQFPVIDICNSQCQMCRIWENKKSDDISPEDLRRGLRNPLYSEVGGVGLNGGEPTLRKDLGQLAAILFEELPKLRSISLITNAYKYDEVIERIIDVGTVVKKHGGLLDVMVSLDGFGDVHDRVRGKPGNFERAQKVIDFVQKSPLVTSVRIGCTIIKENVYGLADLFEYCQSRGLYIKYRIGIPHQRLYTQNLLDPYALTTADKYHIAEFMEGLIAHYETGEYQNFFYRSLIDQLVLNAPRRAGCDWQHRGATITSKGELLYCAVQSKVLGDITKDNSQEIYFNNATHLKDIILNKCDSCNHDYVGLPPKKIIFKQFVLQRVKNIGLEQPARRALKLIDKRWLQRRRFESRLHALSELKVDVVVANHSESTVGQVLICGWYGTETLGDKAILGGVIHAIRQTLGAIKITLVSLFPYVSEITRLQMPELKGARIVDPTKGIQLAGNMSLVVFGGGPLMASIDQMAEMETIFSVARRNGVPTLIAGCGVGPLGKDWHNESIKRILSLADLRIYRDSKSKELAASLGVIVTDDIVVEDPAFTWLKNNTAQQSVKPPTDSKVLLLGLRDFPYIQYAADLGKDQCLVFKERYEVGVISALEQLVAQHPDLLIRPLPMCTNHFGDDDRWFYRRLFRGKGKLAAHLDLSLLGAELAPIQYIDAFRSAHVALTMRFHSLVFALGLEVPAIAIDYTLGKGKVRSLAERFGVPFQSLSEIDAGFIVQEVNRLLQTPAPQAVGFMPRFSDELAARLPAVIDRGDVLA